MLTAGKLGGAVDVAVIGAVHAGALAWGGPLPARDVTLSAEIAIFLLAAAAAVRLPRPG